MAGVPGGPVVDETGFGQTLRNVAPVVIGVLISIMVAVVVLSITGGMGYYILGVFNNTGVTIPAKVNFLNTAITIMPGAVTLLVIMVFIAIIAMVIIMLAKASRAFTATGF